MAKKTAPPQPKPSVPPPPAGILELDRFSEASLTKWNELSHDIDQLANELFYSVRPEQKRLREDILGAIRSVPGKAFQIDKWSRIVTYKYSLQPLSCAGSMLTVGGRFNPGAELDADTMAPFPALYMAQDYETAFRKKFQIASDKTVEGLKPQELALEHGASHSTIQLRGQVHNVFDMTIKHLDTAAAVFRRIKMPDRAKALKKKLAMKDLRMVTTGLELHRAALEYNWRQGPSSSAFLPRARSSRSSFEPRGSRVSCTSPPKDLGAVSPFFPIGFRTKASLSSPILLRRRSSTRGWTAAPAWS